MLSDVMDYFGFERELDHLGFFETEQQKHLEKELQKLLRQGKLVALSGIVGSGKTTAIERLQHQLKQAKDVIVSRSLAIDKERVNLAALIAALFYDLSPEEGVKLPTRPELRERKLLKLFEKCRKPVVLFIDDAHGLHSQTLVRLKRLVELIRCDGGTLSVVLVGHPKLKNDLRRPSLEEIGARTTIFSLEGIRGCQRDYIEWVLKEATGHQSQPTELLSEEALVFLAERLSTPLQIEQYLTLAFERAFQIGQKPVTPDILTDILAQGLDEMEPYLTRHGYNAKTLAQLLNIRVSEVRSFLQGQLAPGRTQELREQMLKVGIPLLAS